MALSPSSTLDAPLVHITHPPSSLFKFPPDPFPSTLPAPVKDGSISNPFTIPPNVYNKALSVSVPLTVAVVYATSVVLLNQVNQRRAHKPWAFSRSRLWKGFVIVHNVVLAVYSAWTFVGMVNAVNTSWPGWKREYGLAEAVDALCKIHGPRGLGDAATYNSTSNVWQLTNRALHLAADGLAPDTTDVGRIWNEGLAFYGWLFYISKFYEVLDTAIILAKGKKSSLLQTYHHAGAMMCMWAGIRYMAPPIWMFVLVNSGIHALMYTYYTLGALNIKVPVSFKRSLTTLQIFQFVVGATFAAAHLFIAYDIPVSVPYNFTLDNISSAIPEAASTVSSAVASFTATGGIGSYVKKLVLRAGGAEGVAEKVLNDQGETFGIDAVHAVEDAKSREEIRYRLQHRTIHCTDTSGQAFAIYLNVIYLLPLTGLFVRFFIRSYLNRTHAVERKGGQPAKGRTIEKAGKDAWKGVGREVVSAVSEMHGSGPADDEEDIAKANSSRKQKNQPEKKSGNASSGGKETDSKSSTEKTSGDKESEMPSEDEASKQDDADSETAAESSKKKEPASDAVKKEPSADDGDKDAAAYEANADETMSKDEKTAEAEMQPNGTS